MEIKIDSIKFEELMKEDKLLVVDFFATWCGPCQMFLPVFGKVAIENENTDVNMATIDIDQERELTNSLGIQGVPTIIAFKGGQEVARFSGFRPEEELKAFIESVK